MSPHASDALVIYATDQTGRSQTIVIDRDSLLDFVVENLVSTWNARWRDPDEPALDHESFRSRISLPETSLESDLDESGCVRLYLDIGDLFCDHAICVAIDESGGFRYAAIE